MSDRVSHSEFKKGFVTKESENVKNEILEYFDSGIFWIHLFAEMQSGKTDTYLFAACEWLRKGKIDNIEIICGSSDLCLKQELKKKLAYFINTTYRHFMEDQLDITRDEMDLLIEKLNKNSRIIWGTDLKKNIVMNPVRTIFIIEESHFGQSKNMMIDEFLKKVGICANGDYEMLNRYNNYVISVSATGFSEISNMVLNNNFCKALVRLKPGRSYYGVKQMRDRGKIKGFKCSLKALEQACKKNYGRPGYGLVRMKNKDIKKAEEVAIACGYKVKHFDSEKRDDGTFISSLDELENVPEEPTIIFLKDKCRMGKEVPKQHIVFCIETAKSSKTDTLLQGLLGRICGYFFHDIEMYIHESILNSGEIDLYIGFTEGGQLIPCKAANLKSGVIKVNKKGGNPIIPLKIDAETLAVDYSDNNREHLLDSVIRCLNNFNVINYNGDEQSREIFEKINRLERGDFLIHKIERKNKSHKSAPKRLFETFSAKMPGGPGTSMNVRADGEQISLMYFNQAYPEYQIEKGCVFIYTTTKTCSPILSVNELFGKIPKTNNREIFCRKPEELI